MGPIFVLFLAELGLDKAQIGLLLSFFPLAGIVAPFVAPLVARIGYKRTFVTLWGARKVVAAGLLLTPFVASRYGPDATLRFVAGDMAVFALCRAVAETGMYPWMREFVPDRVRGRFAAMDGIFGTLFGFLAVSLAGVLIARMPGLGGYMVLIAVAVVFGFMAVFAAVFIPGGAPLRDEAVRGLDRRATAAALTDGPFMRFLAGLGLMTLAVVPLNAFLPLLARERIGLAQSQVIFLQSAVLVGGLLSSYLWGWAADRSGSKRVMLAGVLAAALLPALWLAVPQRVPWSYALALGAAFVTGASLPAWTVGSSRFLFMDVVPPSRTPQYMAVFYAWAGVTGAAGAIFSGRILEQVQHLPALAAFPGLDAYGLLFSASILSALGSLAVLRRAPIARNVL
jgi:MFS family permease